MNFVKCCRSCIVKIYIFDVKFDVIKIEFLNKIKIVVIENDILFDFIYNWDYIGLYYVFVLNWIMEV